MNPPLSRPRTTFASLLFLLGANAAPAADAVTEWNAIMEATVATSNPFAQARSAAITQLAVFEAVNAIVDDYEPYLDVIRAPRWASPKAAAIAAAHRALVVLHPGNAANLDALRATSLSAIPNGPRKDAGIAVGIQAADAMLALRSNDGASTALPLTPGTGPGEWQPTPPLFGPASLAAWGEMTPFAIEQAAQFRSPPPPALHTGKYARAYLEVQEVGHVNSTERPQDRTDVARFFAAASAVQVWNSAARQASASEHLTLAENARCFALIALAICDASIACFETKYHFRTWRPVTAIQAGAADGNGRTTADPSWLPLIGTPPFPSYPSAHASLGGAARAVLERFFGEDGHTIVLTHPALPGVVLNYCAWEQITDDIDDARIYGGIHFRFDQEAGARQGRRVGSYLFRHELRPKCRRFRDTRHGGWAEVVDCFQPGTGQ